MYHTLWAFKGSEYMGSTFKKSKNGGTEGTFRVSFGGPSAPPKYCGVFYLVLLQGTSIKAISIPHIFIFCTPLHFFTCKFYARKVPKIATKISVRQNSIGLRTCCFGWCSWCLLHWDGVFVTSDGAFRAWDSVSGIFIKKNVRISVYVLGINFAKSSPSRVL